MRDDQPIAHVRWVQPDKLTANGYNPNRVFGPELELLKESLLASGWTQPIVARPDGEIVDGFHRWLLTKVDGEVAKLGDGRCPVVYLPEETTQAEQMMATVRHNRARGQHGIVSMSDIVRKLLDELPKEDVMRGLGMEAEEVERLSDMRSTPDKQGKESFGRGWIPDPSAL